MFSLLPFLLTTFLILSINNRDIVIFFATCPSYYLSILNTIIYPQSCHSSCVYQNTFYKKSEKIQNHYSLIIPTFQVFFYTAPQHPIPQTSPNTSSPLLSKFLISAASDLKFLHLKVQNLYSMK